MTFFPIPDEFYRDPPFLGWSAEAYALWMLAGSWSADRLTDGSVPTTALALFPPNVSAAAEELVERRVWKRARGGFQYLDWPKECSRAVVEAKREAARTKKARQRAGYSAPPQQTRRSKGVVSPGDRPGDNPGDSPGTDPGSPSPSSKPGNQGKEDQPPSGVGAHTRATATRIPDDFDPTDAMVAWAREKTPLVGRHETDQFRDYWAAADGRTARKRDWVAAWRVWMRKAQTDAEQRNTRTSTKNGGYQSATDANIAAFLGPNSTRPALTGGEP